MNSIGSSVKNCVSKPLNFGMSCMHVVLWIDDYNADSDSCVCVVMSACILMTNEIVRLVT